MRRIAALASILLAAGASDHAAAQTPGGLGDLVGAGAAGAESAMQARGYRNVGGSQGDDRTYTNWWNGSIRQCVSVATMDGRYASITSTPAADCNQQEQPSRRDDRNSGGARYNDQRPADRDRGYRPPDISYQNNGSAPRQSPSYAQDESDRYHADGQYVDLGLVCFGDGQRPGFATTYGWSWNSRTRRYDYGNRTELTGQQFDASVMIQLWAGGGRIKLPRKLIPPINSRGSDGWWDLYDVSMGREVISAKYRLNGLNKPSVTINRRRGQISIVGMAPYGFRGECDLIDGQDHRRF